MAFVPAGGVQPGRNGVSSADYDHGYQGQFTEHDEETGWDAFELRMYDGRMARWMSDDPYRQYHSSYLAMGNNPISGVDPDGGFSAIGALAGATVGAAAYGIHSLTGGNSTQGGFLAATLGGALLGGLGGSGLGGVSNVTRGINQLNRASREISRNRTYGEVASSDPSFAVLHPSDRPDEDGYITYLESRNWYRKGDGQTLYADLDKIDLSGISQDDFPNGVGSSKSFNLLKPRYSKSLNDGLVYGSITLTLHYGNKVHATFGYDLYDFDLHPWNSIKSSLRNVEAILGKMAVGRGRKYYIQLRGLGTIGN